MNAKEARDILGNIINPEFGIAKAEAKGYLECYWKVEVLIDGYEKIIEFTKCTKHGDDEMCIHCIAKRHLAQWEKEA